MKNDKQVIKDFIIKQIDSSNLCGFDKNALKLGLKKLDEKKLIIKNFIVEEGKVISNLEREMRGSLKFVSRGESASKIFDLQFLPENHKIYCEIFPKTSPFKSFEDFGLFLNIEKYVEFIEESGFVKNEDNENNENSNQQFERSEVIFNVSQEEDPLIEAIKSLILLKEKGVEKAIGEFTSLLMGQYKEYLNKPVVDKKTLFDIAYEARSDLMCDLLYLLGADVTGLKQTTLMKACTEEGMSLMHKISSYPLKKDWCLAQEAKEFFGNEASYNKSESTSKYKKTILSALEFIIDPSERSMIDPVTIAESDWLKLLKEIKLAPEEGGDSIVIENNTSENKVELTPEQAKENCLRELALIEHGNNARFDDTGGCIQQLGDIKCDNTEDIVQSDY